MLRFALVTIVALSNTWSSGYAQEREPTPTPITIETCKPQPQCRAKFTNMMPAREHDGMNNAIGGIKKNKFDSVDSIIGW
jgi:hypothetical protein